MQFAPRLGAVQTFTMSGTSQSTTAFGAYTRMIRVATATQPAFIRITDGASTAVNSDTIIPLGWVEYFTVGPGQILSVLQAGTAGSITVTELV